MENGTFSLAQLKPKAAREFTPKDGRRARQWRREENTRLRAAVLLYPGENWSHIACHMPGRSPIECLLQWQRIKRALRPPSLKAPKEHHRKKKWSIEESAQLFISVRTFGKQWDRVANDLRSKSAKSAQRRYEKVLQERDLSVNKVEQMCQRYKQASEDNGLKTDLASDWSIGDVALFAVLVREFGSDSQKWEYLCAHIPDNDSRACKDLWENVLHKYGGSFFSLAEN